MNVRAPVLRFLSACLFAFGIFFAGCGPSPVNEKKIASSEAYTKFLQIAKEDYTLEPVTHWVKNTLWIYLPITESLFDLKAKDASPTNDQPSEKYNIQFIEGAYKDQQFIITYDIAKVRNYPKDYGYGTSYSQEYQNKQRNLMTAITRAFENAQEKLEFLVIVIADINKGIELKMTVAYQDLDRASKDQTFYEEYAYRAVLTPPQGNTAIINDQTGKHLTIQPVLWPDFLANQMVYRIQFKYQQSSFPPTDTPEQTILSAVAQTLKAYNFTDYAGVVLRNLASDETKVVDQAAIAALPTEESKGRLIEIKFR